MASHPTIGVEEEFLLVDPDTGEPVACNEQVAAHAAEHGVKLQLELTSCQIETTTDVVGGSADLRDQLTRLRRITAEAAEASGAQLLAVGLPPAVPHEFPITDTPRYREIADKFGMIAHEQGICGCHVHVAVPSREAAIRVSNRLRPWLPLLLALTANSAVYRAADTGYASWRSVLWARWPSAGPPPHFDSVDEYDAVVADAAPRRRRARRRHGLLGRAAVGQLPDRRGARRRRARHGRRDGAAGHADQGLRDDGAGRRTAWRTDTPAGAARVEGGLLEVRPRRPRRSRPSTWKAISPRPRECCWTASSTACGRPSKRSATTNWCVANSIALSSRATGRCGSGGRFAARGQVADVIAEAATATLSDA